MSRLLTEDEIERQLTELPGWSRTESGGDPAITASFTFDGFAGSMTFVNTVADLAEQAQHHPDIDIRWDTVTLVLSTHSEKGLTQADIELAHQVSGDGAQDG